MSYQENLQGLDAQQSFEQQQTDCSREAVDRLMARMEGLEGELVGHYRDGHHIRSHLGKSFGRPEGEIQEDIDEVQAQLRQCNL